MQAAIVSDDAAKALAVAITLTELKLADGTLTDDGVSRTSRLLTKLQSLTLAQNSKVRGTTVPALVTLKELNALSLSKCALGDLAGWSALKKLPEADEPLAQ